jgi:hypothetical protein
MAAPPSRPGQERGDQFMTMVGNCITEWANVEEALFSICWLCLGCTKEKAAIVYYRTPYIDVRMSLVDELVKSTLPKKDRQSGGHDHPDVRRWDRVERDFRDLQHIRRRIAHHPVIMTRNPFRDDHNSSSIGETSFGIYVSQSEAARGRSTNLRPLTINDLHRHLQKVNLVTEELHQFVQNVLPRHIGASPPPEPPPNRTQIPSPHSPTKPQRRLRSIPP